MALIHSAAFEVPRPWSEAEIADLLAQPVCFALTEAEGFVIGRVVAGEGELLTIAVQPAAQGHGVGLRLMRGFVAACAEHGAETVFLEVAESNLAARAVYARAGFAQTGRRRDYYHLPDGRSVDALVMFRKL